MAKRSGFVWFIVLGAAFGVGVGVSCGSDLLELEVPALEDPGGVDPPVCAADGDGGEDGGSGGSGGSTGGGNGPGGAQQGGGGASPGEEPCGKASYVGGTAGGAFFGGGVAGPCKAGAFFFGPGGGGQGIGGGIIQPEEPERDEEFGDGLAYESDQVVPLPLGDAGLLPDAGLEVRRPPHLPEDIDPPEHWRGKCCHVDCPGGPDEDCPAVCGDGVVAEGWETCDGDCPTSCEDDGDPCTQVIMRGHPAICIIACEAPPQMTCLDGDGCCPLFCTNENDEDCPVPSGEVGSMCASDADCVISATAEGDPKCLTAGSMHGGYCSMLFCEMYGCPEGSFCGADVAAGIPSRICLEACNTDADCAREGYLCYEPMADVHGSGRGACLPAGTGEGAIGEACQINAQCGGGPEGRCFLGGEEPGPDTWGICGRLCEHDPNNPDADCPTGSTCGLTSPPLCMPKCSGDADCAEGQTCLVMPPESGYGSHCIP